MDIIIVSGTVAIIILQNIHVLTLGFYVCICTRKHNLAFNHHLLTSEFILAPSEMFYFQNSAVVIY